VVTLVLRKRRLIGDEDRDRLCGIDGTAPAECDDRFTLMFAENVQSLGHVDVRRIGLHPGKHADVETTQLLGHEPSRDTARLQESVRHEQDPSRAKSCELRPDFPRRAGTRDDRGGNVEVVDHGRHDYQSCARTSNPEKLSGPALLSVTTQLDVGAQSRCALVSRMKPRAQQVCAPAVTNWCKRHERQRY
jgi:hypothetical protein